ncbi:unnamed protein product [Victoria cruziana]
MVSEHTERVTVSEHTMSYFETSSRKRSRENGGFRAAAEMVHQRKRGGLQMIEQPTIVDAIEKPKVRVDGGNWTMATKKRAEVDFVTDHGSEFPSPSSVLSVDFSDWFVIRSDEFLLHGYGALEMGLLDYDLVEQMLLGWLPCSDADLMSFYGDGDGGDLTQMSLWEDDIWKLRDIHETPTRKES